jgi:hypothetical protein
MNKTAKGIEKQKICNYFSSNEAEVYDNKKQKFSQDFFEETIVVKN